MGYWMAAAGLAACWPLMGAGTGAATVRRLGLPDYFLAPAVFASGSLWAYLLLWVYFANPVAGRAAWAVLVVSNGAWMAAVLWRHRRAPIAVPIDAWAPFALTILATVACLSCLACPGLSPPKRFTLALPLEDHLVPQLFADRLAAGIRREPRPLAPLTTFALTTQTSDRPPLQAAVALAARPGWTVSAATRDYTYQTVGTLCQATVLPALLALLSALNLSAREKRFVLAAVICSGFFLVNAIYPWPKLYAAGLWLTALALLVHCTRTVCGVAHAVALGALAALALLAHGSPMFSLIGVPALITHSAVRRLATARASACAAAAAGLLFCPWIAYQTYVDPPGTRLLKIHLAGELAADGRGVLATVVDAYRATGPGAWGWGRLENLRAQGADAWHGRDPIAEAQEQQFFRLLPSLGILAIGLAGVIVQQGKPGDALGLRTLIGYAAFAWLLWMIVMLRPGSAVIHHGSYATTLLFFTGGAVGLAGWGRIGTTLLLLNVSAFALIWLQPRAGTPVLGWHPAALLLGTASIVSMFVLSKAWLMDRQRDSSR